MSDFGPGYGLRAYEEEPVPATSGYYGAPAPAAVAPTSLSVPTAGLGVDPAHLAFLRALGLQDFTDSTSAQLAVDALNRRAGMSLEDLKAQGADQRQGIADSHEARGLWRSGGRLRAQSKQEEAEARQAAGIMAGTADQTAGLIAELAQRRAASERSRAEQSLATADRVVGSGY